MTTILSPTEKATTAPSRPRLLDLFSGAGGAARGYQLAGFDVVAVDLLERRHRPDGIPLLVADARDVLEDLAFVRSFDAVHASPPCQTHTRAKHLRDAQGKRTSKLDLVDQTRQALRRAGVPFVLENVPGAPVRPDLVLCGSMFPELVTTDADGHRRPLRRHRVFESTAGLLAPGPCCHADRPLGVYGSKADRIPSGGQTCSTLEQARELMGMPWASWAGLVEAIPPAYSFWIGTQLAVQVGA